jgi:Uma2 family endonuclease
MTLRDFLTWDDGTDARYELIDGRVRSIPRPDAAHSVIVAKLGGAVAAGLESPWYAGLSAGVVRADRDDIYLQADLVASRSRLEKDALTIPNPALIIEVVSAETIEHDSGRKLCEYRSIGSVEEIALVWSHRRRASVWRRQGARWQVRELIGEGELELQAVGVRLPFAEIYANSGV